MLVYVFGRAVGLAEVWLGMYEGTSVNWKASGGVVSNSDSSITTPAFHILQARFNAR